MTTTAAPVESKKSLLSSFVLLLVPLLLLAGVTTLFMFTKGAGLNVTPAAPIETFQIVKRPFQLVSQRC